MLRNRHVKVGREAEAWLATQLQSRGWEILARNFRRPGFELDIVAQKHGTLVFFEVKLRQHLRQIHPDQLLSKVKRRRLRHGIQGFLGTWERRDWRTARIDLAVLSPNAEDYDVLVLTHCFPFDS